MNIIPTELPPQYIVRGDEITDTIEFYSDEACTAPTNVPAHVDVLMDLREHKRETSKLIASISKGAGEIGVYDNVLSYSFGGQNIPARAYHTDIRLIVADKADPVTLCSRVINIVNNVTEIPAS